MSLTRLLNSHRMSQSTTGAYCVLSYLIYNNNTSQAGMLPVFTGE